MLVSPLVAEGPAAGDAAGIIFRFMFFLLLKLRHAEPDLVEPQFTVFSVRAGFTAALSTTYTSGAPPKK